MARRNIPRLMVAGVASGVGKTTVMVALAGALRAMGLRVAVFKGGPDYLDPTWHARAAGCESHNLDGWMMGREAVLATLSEAAWNADIALIEGMMGLYDGASATSEEGSGAELAKWLQAPVLLVADASGMARSLGALVLGFQQFDRELRLAGVIANRVGSRGHLEWLRGTTPAPAPLLGGFPKDVAPGFPERHLGLHTASSNDLDDALFAAWAAAAREWLDLEEIVKLARSAPALDLPAPVPAAAVTKCRIGVARDAAFHFYYADNLRRLRELGAELCFFSPLEDAGLPAVDVLYIGGGYPETHAAQLAGNAPMLEAIRGFAGPVYAECGGLMYMTEAIRTLDGARHAMVGRLQAEVEMHARLQALGYMEVTLQRDCLLGAAGIKFRGHQFRYSELRPTGRLECAYRLRSGAEEGYVAGSMLASYVHAHWASNPAIPVALVRAACGQRH
jgi:cobyrinic acid a,c-diamide synthase